MTERGVDRAAAVISRMAEAIGVKDSDECCMLECESLIERSETPEELLLSRLLCFNIDDEYDTFAEIKRRTLELISAFCEVGADPFLTKQIADEIAEMPQGGTHDQGALDSLISRSRGITGRDTHR